ncbi:MAG: FG-GAP-like repeat-containing protein, partial [Bacteroidota bacterium]
MRRASLFGLILSAWAAAPAQVPYGVSPSWVSAANGLVATGAAWLDVDRDGRLDLAVACGNDIARQRVVLYGNGGTGTLPIQPTWQSGDVDFHGHAASGDVNGDGFPDLAVSVYLGPAGFSQRGRVKLYLNAGGTLCALPSWTSRDSLYSFSCSFGDADGDGDLDLAVAGGEAYGSRPERNRIYFNRGGTLDSLPGWMAARTGYSYDVAWMDVELDGDLDLVFADTRGSNHLYLNRGDSIDASPAWESADAPGFANSLFAGDINGDGFPDLAVSDNSQLGGSGRFKMYRNAGGTLEQLPFWTSAWGGYGSGITLADCDGDGDRDLLTGGWWQPCRIYLNAGGVFPPDPQWSSATGSVVEAIVCGDVDGDGLEERVISFPGDGFRKLFLFGSSPLHEIRSVMTGGDTLPPSAYCYDLENGWISTAAPVPAGTWLRAHVRLSGDLDFAVTNWDGSVGDYLFLNTGSPSAVPPQGPAGEGPAAA